MTVIIILVFLSVCMNSALSSLCCVNSCCACSHRNLLGAWENKLIILMPSASTFWSDRLDGHFQGEGGLVSCTVDRDRWLMQNVLWPSWRQPGKSPTRPYSSFIQWQKGFPTLYMELTSFRNPARPGAKCKEGMEKLQFSIKVWIHLVHHRRERKLLQTCSCMAYQWYSMVIYGRPFHAVVCSSSSSFFFFRRLISAAADWMSAILPHSTHGVALVWI